MKAGICFKEFAQAGNLSAEEPSGQQVFHHTANMTATPDIVFSLMVAVNIVHHRVSYEVH